MLVPLQDLKKYTPGAILSITSYVDMFPSTLEGVKEVVRQMSNLWHPDKHPEEAKVKAQEVFHHVRSLADQATKQLAAGVWGNTSVVVVHTLSSDITFSYLRTEEIPGFATQYIGKSRVAYVISQENRDLVDVWAENLKRLEVAAAEGDMTADQHLANATQIDYGVRDLKSGGKMLFVSKERDFLCLKHILSLGSLDPKHAAWIATRLMRIACVMQIAGVPNLDLTSRSVFVSPKTHSLIMFDGWQFADKFGLAPRALPERTNRLCPDIAINRKVEVKHCIVLIKTLIRECLGFTSDALLLASDKVPKAFSKWVMDSPTSDAIKELAIWESAKKEAFGPALWVDLNVTESQVYPT